MNEGLLYYVNGFFFESVVRRTLWRPGCLDALQLFYGFLRPLTQFLIPILIFGKIQLGISIEFDWLNERIRQQDEAY